MAQLPDRPGPALILKMINDVQNTTYTQQNVSFGLPEPSTDPARDTQIAVTFTGGSMDGVTKTFYYDRLDLAILLSQWNMTFTDNGQFANVSDALVEINTRCSLHLTLDDVQDDTFDLSTYPATLALTPMPASLVLHSTGVAQFTVTQSESNPSALMLDLTYVDEESAQFSTFLAYVDNAVNNGPAPEFSALDAAYAYRITGDESYRELGINIIDAEVTAAELRIGNGLVPIIANDNYLEIGPRLTALSVVYAWCNPDTVMRNRWTAYADRAIGNLWDHTNAYWGETPAPWSGWSVNDPGNNYYYSFCIATATWALASNNTSLLTFLNDEKLVPLQTYMTAMLGGGSREGTGYGISLMTLFDLYMFWRDSGQPDIANANDHLRGSIYYWVHATVPTLDRYCPIGDLSRESYPNLFDYHRSMMLKARDLTNDQTAKDMASWWLNNISVQTMQQSWQRKYNMLPAGDYNLPPEYFSYRAEGPGTLFARTSWEEDAVYFHFLAGIYDQSHAHQAQGSFVFFRNDFLAVTNNIFSNSGIRGDVKCQNVLRFDDSVGDPIAQVYGEAGMSSTILGASGDVNAQATLADIMGGNTVETWERDVFFREGVLEVFDDYVVNSGTTATFQICMPNEPGTINGNEVLCGDLEVIVLDPPTATITSTEMSSEDPDYQSGWRLNISGGEMDATTGRYEVELRSVGHSGSATGVNARPRFAIHPTDQTVLSGGAATFEALATGPGTITYAWEMSTGGAYDETGDYDEDMTISGLSGNAVGWRFRCKATNAHGSTYSRVAKAIIQLDVPQITVQPQSISVVAGGNASFDVTATAIGAINYDWQIYDSINETWSSVPYYANPLELSGVTLGDTGRQYRCVLSTSEGEVTSDVVTLTVTADSGQSIPDYMLRTTAAGDGAYIAENLFPGGNGFTFEALVYIDAGSPSTWGNLDILMQAVYIAGRLHVVRTSNGFTDAQVQVYNNSSGGQTNFIPTAGVLYLLTLSSDTGDNDAGTIRATMQEVNNPAAPVLTSIHTKGQYFGTTTSMTQLGIASAGLNGDGWATGLRFQWVRCYNTYRSEAQIEADRTNTDPAGAMFWWQFADNGAGGITTTDLSGNATLPDYVQGAIATFA